MAHHVYGPDGNRRGSYNKDTTHRDPPDDDDGDEDLDPLADFTPDECRQWNLDIKMEKGTRLFNGHSETYEAWRELIVDMCATHWFKWRGLLTKLVNFKDPLTTQRIMATGRCYNLTGPQLTVLPHILWAHLGRCMDPIQRRSLKRTAGESLNGFEV